MRKAADNIYLDNFLPDSATNSRTLPKFYFIFLASNITLLLHLSQPNRQRQVEREREREDQDSCVEL